MRRLYVLYDEDCGLCRQAAAWLASQPALIPLDPIPAQSALAARLLPGRQPGAPPQELAVGSDQGAVYLGDRARIMCLYALRDYRHWAEKLAHPLLMPLARKAFTTLSKHRLAISRFMGEQELADQLKRTPDLSCAIGSDQQHVESHS